MGASRHLRRWEIEGTDGRRCDILVGRNIADPRALVPEAYSRVALVAQPSVANRAELLLAAIRESRLRHAELLVLPDGEAAKELGVVGDTYRWLNGIDFTRDGLLVAIGGGSLTDVAGFVAATYLRGIEVVYLPTTLLGAVDASIGGKTGINVDGKNLVGAFRHPQRIVVDLDLLDELGRELRREGAAEIVKAGFIADEGIIAAYEADGVDVALDTVVPAAIAVKVATVRDDFRESGRRAILNYGHTIGHAIEVAAGITHGEAVAIGMVAAGRVSSAVLGFAGSARQRSVLEKIGLPTTAPPVSAERVMSLVARDKKRDRRGLRMVLLRDFGEPVVQRVSVEDVQQGLAEIGIVPA
jgi:3-dehydroquinate synthase